MTPEPPITGSVLFDLRDNPNDDTWARFVRTYAPLYRKWMCKIVGDDHADDAAQAMFDRLRNAIRQYDREKGRFRGYLYRTAINAAKDYYRAHQKGPEVAIGDLEDVAIPEEINDAMECDLARLALDNVRPTAGSRQSDIFEALMSGQEARAVALSYGTTIGAVYKIKSRVKKEAEEELKRLKREFDGG